MSIRGLSSKADDGACLSAVGVIALLFVNAFIHGWVLSVLWRWFIVPVFDLPLLTIAQAIGIGLAARVFIGDRTGDKKENATDLLVAFASSIFVSFFILSIGWIVLQFV